MAPYRPPGRSNRSGRTQADNDVFEGLPVKQWTSAPARISLAPPSAEHPSEQSHDRWGEPPMPRDYQLLQPWTQQLLRLARSGKVGQKRKPARDAEDVEGEEYGGRDEDGALGDDANGNARLGILGEDRAFVARKWRPVPEHALVPEQLHWQFLVERRKGLPGFYNSLNGEILAVPVPTRKAKVQKVVDAATGESAVYEVIVPEGQTLEGEIAETSELAAAEPKALPAGTVIEGLGVANEEGMIVAEVRYPAAAATRRNRPPPKRKGGPGRGKKRVTFTNPDGSTYTTIVPNATKIVPQPGQTIKHVAKGEEAVRDVSAAEAADLVKDPPGDGEGDGGEGDEEGDEDDEGDEEGEGEGDEDDDREDGELVDEEIELPMVEKPEADTSAALKVNDADVEEVDVAELAEVSVEAPAEALAVVPAEGSAEAPAEAPAELPDTSMPDAAVADSGIVAEEPAVANIEDSADVPLAQPPTVQDSTVEPPDDAEAPTMDASAAPKKTHVDEMTSDATDEEHPVTVAESTEEAQMAESVDGVAADVRSVDENVAEAKAVADNVVDAEPAQTEEPTHAAEEGEEDLLGSLERHLEGDGK